MVLVAVVVRILALRLINKITAHAAEVGNGKTDAAHTLTGERRRQRTKALGSVLRQRRVGAHLRHRRGDHRR